MNASSRVLTNDFLAQGSLTDRECCRDIPGDPVETREYLPCSLLRVISVMDRFILKMRYSFFCLALWFVFVQLPGQVVRGDMRFVWYNVENFFDPFDDSLVMDDEFLPRSPRHWTWSRFVTKAENTAKVIAATGGWTPPEIVGLAEVENAFVLHRLCRETPLLKYDYHWIHRDSPDQRGIDIALLYRPVAFRPLQWSFQKVCLDPGTESTTRDILYVKGIAYEKDTLHLILNHWPSRWEGKLATQYRRIAAAKQCRKLFDSIVNAGSSPAILVAGDFNDETSDPSIREVLGICDGFLQACGIMDTSLYCLGFKTDRQVRGSLKYRGSWFVFDQVFASGRLILKNHPGGEQVDSGIFCREMQIYRPGFLLERDEQWTGVKPYRTWNGYRYHGGFSDHLPIIVDLFFMGSE